MVKTVEDTRKDPLLVVVVLLIVIAVGGFLYYNGLYPGGERVQKAPGGAKYKEVKVFVRANFQVQPAFLGYAVSVANTYVSREELKAAQIAPLELTGVRVWVESYLTTVAGEPLGAPVTPVTATFIRVFSSTQAVWSFEGVASGFEGQPPREYVLNIITRDASNNIRDHYRVLIKVPFGGPVTQQPLPGGG